MPAETKKDPTKGGAAKDQRMVWLGVLWGIVWPGLLGVVLFVASGRWRWPLAWAYLVLYAVVLVAGSVLAIHPEADFATERTRAKEGTKSWDKVLAGPLFSLPWLALYIVAGLDKRYGWSQVGKPVAVAAVVLSGLGYAIAVWAMASNRFYGRYVRIQTERGHTVVSGGPYRYVRHPGYAGIGLFMLASALALESSWALVPAAILVAVLVIRTALEDRTLQAELEGYKDYVRRVRFRLVPYIW